MKFKILKNHKRNCNAVRHVREKTWDHPWGIITKSYSGGTVSYPHPRRGHTHWFIVGCKCTDCPAELAVRFDDIMRKAPIISHRSK